MTRGTDFSKKKVNIISDGIFANAKESLMKYNDKSVVIDENFNREIINTSPIQNFYNNEVIFITGGTGFLGKTLIEKLLRSCSSIKRIYLLVRQKRNRSIQERIEDLLNDTVFDIVRPKLCHLQEKLIGLAGDCSLNNLGLSDEDMNLLKREVSIVFHVAATIRFNEKLKQAVAINIQSTSYVLDLCKSMKNLKSVIHVSTAYANCFTPNIEEKFYDYSINYKDLLHLVKSFPEEKIDAITPQLMKSWPNTYTFTKALAEDLIRAESQNLPVGIFRPGIVISSAYEPIPGWIDNYNGPTGIIAGAASGVLRTLHVDTTKLANLVPVDLTVNALIASAWNVTTQTDRKGKDMLIYNFSSISEAPLSWEMFKNYTAESTKDYPPKIAMWCFLLQTTKYKLLYHFYVFFLHYLPGFLIDSSARLTGKKLRLQKTYEKIHKMSNVLNHFTMNEWKFRTGNVQDMWKRLDIQDKQLFRFSMQNFDWPEYFTNYAKGIRTYLFKDSSDTLESSKKKYKKLIVIHRLTVSLLYGFFSWMTWIIIRAII